MSIQEAYRHLQQDRPYVNCASAVVHALSPTRPTEAHSRAMINGAVESLTEIAACISLEHARVGHCVLVQPMEPGCVPSDFFRRAQHQATQSGRDTFFIGGLMMTQEEHVRHVVGVFGHHRGRQNMFSVCDTARTNRIDLKRRMTYREMDARIISQATYPEHRAMVLFGRSLQSFKHNPEAQRLFDLETAAAEDIVQVCLYRSGFQYLLQED